MYRLVYRNMLVVIIQYCVLLQLNTTQAYVMLRGEKMLGALGLDLHVAVLTCLPTICLWHTLRFIDWKHFICDVLML